MKPFGYGTVFKLTQIKRKVQLAVGMSPGLLLTLCLIFADFRRRYQRIPQTLCLILTPHHYLMYVLTSFFRQIIAKGIKFVSFNAQSEK